MRGFDHSPFSDCVNLSSTLSKDAASSHGRPCWWMIAVALPENAAADTLPAA